MNILSRSFAGIDFHRLKKIVELQQLLGSAFSANSVVDALCGIFLQLGYTKNIHSSNVIYIISRKKLGWSVELVLGNLAKETVRAKKKHQTTALRAPHTMQQSFGKAGNAVCLHSSYVLRYKLQKSAFCNHGEYESFFSCGAKHAVTGTLFGCMAGNMWQLAVFCLSIQQCLWNILAIWALFSYFQRVCYAAGKHTML